jgi:hypothetical protein
MTTLEQLDRTILLCRDYVADALTDAEICCGFQSLHVLCVSDLHNVSSHSGQTALVTLVSLLSRMGMQVGLAIPDVAMAGLQPPISGESLLQALLASSEALVTGAVVRSDSDFRPDLIFVLGDTKMKSSNIPCWRLSGTDWFGTLAREGTAMNRAWTSEWPIGAMVSAAFGANEAFKFVIRRLRLRDQTTEVFFEPSHFCSWDFGSISVPQDGIDLGQVDMISAGAISQAALYTLLRIPKIEMRGRIFDDDLTAGSNLNRNMLSLVTDVGLPKVGLVRQRCSRSIQFQPVERRFAKESFDGELAQRVLVGVDDIPSRWEVQRRSPGWVAVSATSHFNVSSSAHTSDQACSGCLHPVDDAAGAIPIPTVSFVSFWAGLAMAVRLVREALGNSYSLDRQHLWLTPLRMDERHAAMWLPVAARLDCPVPCLASGAILRRVG